MTAPAGTSWRVTTSGGPACGCSRSSARRWKPACASAASRSSEAGGQGGGAVTIPENPVPDVLGQGADVGGGSLAGSPAGRSDLLAHLAVVGAAVLFGSTFFVVKDAIDDVGPVPFLGVRFLIGALVLAPFARGGRRQGRQRRPRPPGLVRAGGLCGLALAAGYLF